ncbi:cytochrome P450 [Cupriavidus sp. IDO]|uniref:cytochrome P450 n=1 Tax=Cupriavidus sp. IDO TaxID=1539142 RepID=UPI00187BF0C4|nr:cytochrome P450 [Cupriavidus sp. IDO]
MTPADPLAAVTHPDPYPYYRALAARQPFFRHEALGLWVAAGAAEVAAVLAHPDCRVRPPAQPVPPTLAGTAAGELFGRLIRMNDGAAHAPLKGILMRLMANIDPAVAMTRAAALADAIGGSDVDAAGVKRWIFTLPVVAVADLLGMPVAASGNAAEVASQVAAYAASQSPLASAAEVQAGADAAHWLAQWLLDADPSSTGLLPALQSAAQQADVDPAAVAANAIGLMVQACEATAGLAGNSLVRLGREPALLARQDAAALHALVARVARDDPPVQNTRRFLAADALLCGVPVSAGDAVLVLLAAASHDDSHAPSERPWTFGAGRHACPGDALAQALAAATVAALLARGAQPARLVQSLRYRPSLNARIPQFS